MNDDLAKMIFLADETRVTIPRSIAKMVPHGKVLMNIGKSGIEGAGVNLSIPRDQLNILYKEGKKAFRGTPSDASYRTLVASKAEEKLEMEREDKSLEEYLEAAAVLYRFLTAGDSLITHGEFSLNDLTKDARNIAKWNSGFEPLDWLTQQFYQGIVTVMGKPGSGKTSTLLALMGALIQSGACSSVWFYQTEIPERMMRYMAVPLMDRGIKFTDQHRVICGMVTTQEILSDIQDDPDENRVVIFDGPDAMASGGEGRRFSLEAMYQDLVRLKPKVKAVFVSSQMRRKDDSPQLESGAEAWQKAWYSDIIIGLQRIPPRGGVPRVRANLPKNRFGPANRRVEYGFHYEALKYEWDQVTSELGEADDW